MGELLHFSSFTGTFTRITLIICNLQPVYCSKLGEAKNGSPSPFHFLYSIGNERIHSQCVKRWRRKTGKRRTRTRARKRPKWGTDSAGRSGRLM